MYNGDSAAYIYTQGQYYLEGGDYSDAITAFQALNSQYPFNAFTKKATLGLIYAYYQHTDPALTLATASRYVRLYPTDPNAAYAYYMMGVVNFNNGRGFLQRYFPYDMSEHDPSDYVQSYNALQHVETQFPNSPYAPDAKRRMVYLNNVMAQYQLSIAQFYFKKQAYVAAIHRGMNVLIHYPQSPVVEKALVLLLNSYQKLNLTQLANQTAQMLALNFPDNTTAKAYLKAHPGLKVIASKSNSTALNKAESSVTQTKRLPSSSMQAPPETPAPPPMLRRGG